MKKDHKAIGPYSRLFRVGITAGSVDGRSEAGRYLRDAEKQLADHVGGSPSVAQRMLITRLAMISLRLHLLDQKALAGTDWTDLDSRTHGGLSSALRHGLRELGMKAVAAEPPSIAEHLAKRRAAGGDAAA